MSYSVSFFFALCAMWTSMAPTVMAKIHWGYYCSEWRHTVPRSSLWLRLYSLSLTVFIGISCFSIVGIYKFFPETAHKTLEEIGILFGDTVAPTAGDSDGAHRAVEIKPADTPDSQEKYRVAHVETELRGK
jgi:hypothetical protein